MEVFGEEAEAFFIGEDDHSFFTFAVGCVIPHEGEKCGRVFLGGMGASDFVHVLCAFEHFGNVYALEGCWEEAYGGEFAGSAAYPVPEGEGG